MTGTTILRPRPEPTVRHRRPRWMTVALKTLVVVLAVAIILTGLGYVYVRHQLGKINRVDVPGLSGDVSGQVMNVLLVGSDSRSSVGEDLAETTGKEVEGDRQGLSDTMMILHIDPKAGSAAILSIPRDLYLPIAGTGYRDRINTAFAVGGPATLIQTIQDSIGIQINHYAEVDLQGFKNIVDTVGGLKIYLDAPARDQTSGLDLPAGCVQLDGFQALAYVRSRFYETYEAGRWVSDETSDFGRIKRQQDFIRRMMKKAVSSVRTNPVTLNRLIGIGVNNLTIDSGMSTKDMVTVARRFRSLDPDSVEMQTLPTERYITPGGADVQILVDEEAQPIIDRLNGKAPPEAPAVRPSDVQVRVLNGNGMDAAASKAGIALRGAGFEVIGSGADADSFAYQRTVIRYAPTGLEKAQLLQSYLVRGAVLEEDRTLGTADLVLVVGADYAGLRPGPAGPAVSPSTTAAAAPATSAPPDARGSTQPAC